MPPVSPVLDAQSPALIDTIEHHLNDLSTVHIPRLRTCTGPLSTQQLWAAEIREHLERLDKQIEDLDVLVDDQRTERARKELRSRVDAYRTALHQLRGDSRAAVLTSKRILDAQIQSQREELFRSPSIASEKASSSDNQKSTEAAIMTATNKVTEALQRTMGTMQNELERSVFSVQLLESSTSVLASTSEKHDQLSLVLNTSRHLIAALEHTDFLDRLLIITALVFFVLVVAFVLKQRIVNRGLRIAFWWTRFVPLPSWSSDTGVPALAASVTGTSIVSASAIVAASTAIPPIMAVDMSASTTTVTRVAVETGTPDLLTPTLDVFPPSPPPEYAMVDSRSGVSDDKHSTHDEL